MYSVCCCALKIYTISTLYKKNLIFPPYKESVFCMLVWKVGIKRYTNHFVFNVFQHLNFDMGTKVFLKIVIDNDKYILLERNLIKIQLNQSPNAET